MLGVRNTIRMFVIAPPTRCILATTPRLAMSVSYQVAWDIDSSRVYLGPQTKRASNISML
jgi:hypothetical protein